MAVFASETCTQTIVLSPAKEVLVHPEDTNKRSEPVVPYERKWIWGNFIGIVITHMLGIGALLLIFRVKLLTVLWSKCFKDLIFF